MTKIQNIEDLKNDKNDGTKLLTPQEYFTRLMSEGHRVEVSQKIDTFIKDNELGFEEALLGFADYGITVLVKDMVNASGDNKEAIESMDSRFADLRTKIATSLNSSDDVSMGESIVALLSFITESIDIIAKDSMENIKTAEN